VQRLDEAAASGRWCLIEERDGGLARGLYVHPATGGAGVAVVNLERRRRELRLRWLDPAQAQSLTDRLTGQAVQDGAIGLAAYGGRVFLGER
jgi:hypothetical protein